MAIHVCFWTFMAIAHGPSLDHDRYQIRAKAQHSINHVPAEGAIGVYVLSLRSAECQRVASRWFASREAEQRTPAYANIVLEGCWEEAYCIFGTSKEEYGKFFRYSGIVTSGEIFLWEADEDYAWDGDAEAEMVLLEVRKRIGRVGGGRSVEEFPWKRRD